MIGRAIRKLRAGAVWSLTRFRSKAVILLYHRVAEVRSDPWALAVTPSHFAEHVDIIRRYCRPTSLRALVDSIRSGSVPDRSVVVTFDDGYADNLYAAEPLLESASMPATVFVATGALVNPRIFWWDELDRIILQPERLPAELSLEINGVTRRWSLGTGAEGSHPAAAPDRCWRGWDPPRTGRQRLYLDLWHLARPLELHQRISLLDRLACWSGSSLHASPDDRTLLPNEVGILAQCDLIEIGAHSVNHPPLATLPIDGQRAEVQASKRQLEDLLNAPVESFAYPHGDRADYTRETVRMVRNAGFQCSCSAVGGPVFRSTDLYQLPRLYMEDWSGEKFARLLSTWLRIRIP